MTETNIVDTGAAGAAAGAINLTSRLRGKSVLVTGAAAGIGRATVERMTAEGASIIAIDIAEELLAELASIGGVSPYRVDITDDNSIKSLIETVGSVDVLVNCAGIVHAGTILECDDAEWQRLFAVNVTSCFHLIRAVLPAMIAQGSGSIVNIASVVSSLRAAPNRFAYGTSKAAVIGLTKSVATDYIRAGIRCNAVCPGTVMSPSLEKRLHAMGDYEQAREAFHARQPMGRMAVPEEMVGLIAFLASDEASYVTGQCFVADGGYAL